MIYRRVRKMQDAARAVKQKILRILSYVIEQSNVDR